MPRVGISQPPLNINDGFFLSHIPVPAGGKDGLGAKLRYMGYFASLLHPPPPGIKTWFLFSVRDMSWGLRNPCFTKFSVANFL